MRKKRVFGERKKKKKRWIKKGERERKMPGGWGVWRWWNYPREGVLEEDRRVGGG